MNVFLYQEVQRIQRVVKLVRDDLLAVQLAIKGEVTMTQAILVTINELFEAKVPNVWMFTITGLLFSFMLPNISAGSELGLGIILDEVYFLRKS